MTSARSKYVLIDFRVNLQMELEEANNKLEHLNEENAMLKARIEYLEKENNSTIKGYQRPLNRSITKSVNLIRKSRAPNETRLNTSTLNLDTRKSTPT